MLTLTVYAGGQFHYVFQPEKKMDFGFLEWVNVYWVDSPCYHC